MKLCSENGEPITDNHFLIQLATCNFELMTKNLDAKRRNEEPFFTKDGSMIWDESRRTVLHSDQRVHRF